MQASPSSAVPSAPASPLRIPIFRQVWIANLASNFGTLIQSVGAAWMMVSLSHSPAMVALVQSSTTLPIMLLALVAGAVADNFERRVVMIAAQIVMLVVSAILALLGATGHLTPWLLLALTFLIGCGTAFNGPAWQASVGEMVPRAALPGAIVLNGVGFNIARSVGPAIGGAIVAAVGAAGAFLVNAVSYIGLIVVLLRWQPVREPRLLPREALGTAIGAGMRYVALSPHLRRILARATVFGLAASSVSAMMPVVARDMMHGGPLTYGLLLGAFGVGSVAGALGSGRLRSRLSTEWIVRLATAGMMVGTAMTGISQLLPLTMFALLFAGAGWVLALSSFNASVQLSAPRWVVARTLSLYQMFAFGGMAVGSWCFGALAESHGVGTALLAAAGLHAAGIGISFLKPIAQVEDQNLDLLNRWKEPETSIPVEARSGPVVISIEYSIPPDRVLAFLAVMAERRRIRSRDGARHWTLLRDLGDERLWVERYQAPTWLEYIRHNQRRTQADAINSDAIRELHDGTWPPKVHRMLERQTGSLPGARGNAVSEMLPPLTDPTRYS